MTGRFVDFSKNRGGPPKSSILIGFSLINHPFWGTTIFGNTPLWIFGNLPEKLENSLHHHRTCLLPFFFWGGGGGGVLWKSYVSSYILYMSIFNLYFGGSHEIFQIDWHIPMIIIMIIFVYFLSFFHSQCQAIATWLGTADFQQSNVCTSHSWTHYRSMLLMWPEKTENTEPVGRSVPVDRTWRRGAMKRISQKE